MKADSNGEDGNTRAPALSLDSPWAWFYYSTFGVQVVVVTVYILRYRTAIASNSTLDTYIATLLEVSIRIPAMAVYSLLLAVIVEVIRMIAERYLEKRFRQGKMEGREEGREEGIAEGRAEGKEEGIARGIAEVLEVLDEDTRKEVERKLRQNGYSNHFPDDN